MIAIRREISILDVLRPHQNGPYGLLSILNDIRTLTLQSEITKVLITIATYDFTKLNATSSSLSNHYRLKYVSAIYASIGVRGSHILIPSPSLKGVLRCWAYAASQSVVPQ